MCLLYLIIQGCFFFLQQFYTRGIHFPLYLDVKNMSHKGDHRARQHWRLTTHGDKIDYSVVLQGLQRFGIQLWNTSQTEPFPSASWSTSAWHKVRSLFNSSQSPFIYHATYQIHRYNWLTGCFFSLYWMISLSVSVRSTEELGLFLISFQIYFCIWKKSTSVRMNMKSMLSSPENDSIGCLFKLKRAMFMLRTMAQQEVWCCYSEIWLSLWRSGWMVQNVMTHKTEICIIYSMVSINNNH